MIIEEDSDGKILLSLYAITKKDNTVEKDAEHEGKEEIDAGKDAEHEGKEEIDAGNDAEKDAVHLSKKQKI